MISIKNIVVIFIVSSMSCKRPEEKQISIDFKSKSHPLEGKQIYLYDVNNREIIDSSLFLEGKASFGTKNLSKNSPSHLNIKFRTLDSNGSLVPFGIINPYFKNYIEANFYYDQENIYFETDPTYKSAAHLEPFTMKLNTINKQTEVAFRHHTFRYGPGTEKYNEKLAKTFPYSMELVNILYQNRTKFSDQHMTNLISIFDGPIEKSNVFHTLKLYIQAKPEMDKRFPNNISLETPDKDQSENVITKNNWNLVVFWASWCGPCIMEIPHLKKLSTKYEDKLMISSISVDNNKNSWKKALAREEMLWPQYLVSDNNRAILEKKYDLSIIPVWLLFDPNNNLIHRQVGYQDGINSIDNKVAHYIENTITASSQIEGK